MKLSSLDLETIAAAPAQTAPRITRAEARYLANEYRRAYRVCRLMATVYGEPVRQELLEKAEACLFRADDLRDSLHQFPDSNPFEI